MSNYYPVYLSVRNRRCVVVGGGDVAERKVEFLLECGASVTLVSPRSTPKLQGWADDGRITWKAREYQPGDLEGAFLAIAGTDDPATNRAIAQEADAQKVLINVVDVTHLCSFIAPSIVRKGSVTAAISTGGLSPALARKLRVELENSDALQYAELAGLVSQVRAELQREKVTVHPDHWQACLNAEVLQLYRAGREEDARRLLLKSLKKGSRS